MNIDPWILTFSALTVIATIWMGFWSARRSKTAHDFYVAGRSVSVGWNASAISGEYLSAASFMGVAGMVMSSGYDALWYPVCYACGYLFLLLFIAGPLRRFGAYTIPDFAEGRFDSPLFRKIAVTFVLFIGFFYTMPQMKGAGTTLAYIFPGLPYWAGVVLVGAVITLNVALGGMKGITLVQAFQYWLKMFAISVPIFVLMAVYGHYGSHLKVNDAPVPKRVEGKNFELRPVTIRPQLRADMTFDKILSYAKYKFAELKRARGEVSGLLRFTNADLDQMLPIYEALADGIVFKVNVPYPADKYTLQTTNPVTRAEAKRLLESEFTKNGIGVLSYEGNVLVVCPFKRTNEIHQFLSSFKFVDRQPLPTQAPSDRTWISPFGPLTTKAAKAAKPTVTYHGPTRRSEIAFPLPRAVADLAPRDPKIARRVAESAFRFQGTIAGESNTLHQLALNYVHAQMMSEKLNLGPHASCDYAPILEDGVSIYIPTRTVNSYADLAEQNLRILATNGITVVREPGNLFKAFPTKDAVLVPVNTKPYALLYTYSLIIALVCGTAGLPHILVRFYTNPDGVAAKRTTMWVMILIGVFYLFPPVFGVMGRNLLPELYAATGAKGTDKIVLELPRILNERVPMLGSIMSGITCAGAFAAFMSTFSGLLVSITGALAHDIYGRILRPRSTPDQRMKAFKLFAVIGGACAILLGFMVENFEINKLVGWAFAIAATSYFPLLFLSTWWRKITMKGAATGMLVGGTLSLLAIASTMLADQAQWAAGLKAWFARHPLERTLAEQPAIWALPLAIILMVIISKLTQRTVPTDIRMKMLVLHAPEKLGLKQEYIQEHQSGH